MRVAPDLLDLPVPGEGVHGAVQRGRVDLELLAKLGNGDAGAPVGQLEDLLAAPAAVDRSTTRGSRRRAPRCRPGRPDRGDGLAGESAVNRWRRATRGGVARPLPSGRCTRARAARARQAARRHDARSSANPQARTQSLLLHRFPATCCERREGHRQCWNRFGFLAAGRFDSGGRVEVAAAAPPHPAPSPTRLRFAVAKRVDELKRHPAVDVDLCPAGLELLGLQAPTS
jgi:hypothetical protein